MNLFSLSDIDAAVKALTAALRQPGGVALVPTETVYGLIGRAADPLVPGRIYELKARPKSKRLGWFIGNWRRLSDFGVILDGWPEKLASHYTPGALTIIAPRRDGDTIGFRVPDHPLLQKLLAEFDEPLVQTSANLSGAPDPLNALEALKALNGEVDCAVDGGVLPPGARGSTVVDATGKNLKILRQGAVDLNNLL